jgi:hypothetical protein
MQFTELGQAVKPCSSGADEIIAEMIAPLQRFSPDK